MRKPATVLGLLMTAALLVGIVACAGQEIAPNQSTTPTLIPQPTLSPSATPASPPTPSPTYEPTTSPTSTSPATTQTYEVAWEYQDGEDYVGGVITGSDGTIYVARTNSIYALNPDGTKNGTTLQVSSLSIPPLAQTTRFMLAGREFKAENSTQ